jgi:enamine deaminase RidA (YjgF/YER057c/UK114 family)
MGITRLNPDTMHKNPAFSQAAVISSDMQIVYVGGQNAVNAEGKIVGKDIGTQTEQALTNVKLALEAAGATFDDVFKMTIYFVQGQDVQAGFAASQKIIPKGTPAPTISGIMVAGLANPDYLVEIEAVAAIKAK